MNAIDTNVLIYAIDGSEPVKQSQAIGLLGTLIGQSTQLVIPWQVAVEFVACLRRWEAAGRITRDDTLAYKSQLLDSPPIVMPSQDSLALSLDLSTRYSLSYWDSLLIAACIKAGIRSLYSEDLDSGMTYDSVTVTNPFS